MRRFLLLAAFLLLTVTGVSADHTVSLGYRSRLYDVVAHGKDVFAVGHPGLLLRSSDGGEHFKAVAPASREALFSIDINRSGIGAVVGRDGLVLLTRDGGATWNKTNAFPPQAEGAERPHLFAVDVLDSGAIVAVGDFGAIVHSQDQGKTWERRPYAVSVEAEPAKTDEAPAKGKKKKGKEKQAKGKKRKGKKAEPAEDVAQAEPAENEGFLDMSGHENAGAEDEARLTGVSFADDQHGFVVGEFGLILVTNDGGKTWKRQKSGAEGILFGVHALSDKHVIAVGSDGVVLETMNGRSWSTIPTPTHKHLFGVWASNDLVLAVGADGVALSRTGQGPFQAVSTNVHSWLSAITLLDGSNGVIVGGRGRVLNTKDSGRTFALSVKQ
jgi:photosystem II stability/assembly factor-like uncharacterized protein